MHTFGMFTLALHFSFSFVNCEHNIICCSQTPCCVGYQSFKHAHQSDYVLSSTSVILNLSREQKVDFRNFPLAVYNTSCRSPCEFYCSALTRCKTKYIRGTAYTRKTLQLGIKYSLLWFFITLILCFWYPLKGLVKLSKLLRNACSL